MSVEAEVKNEFIVRDRNGTPVGNSSNEGEVARILKNNPDAIVITNSAGAAIRWKNNTPIDVQGTVMRAIRKLLPPKVSFEAKPADFHHRHAKSTERVQLEQQRAALEKIDPTPRSTPRDREYVPGKPLPPLETTRHNEKQISNLEESKKATRDSVATPEIKTSPMGPKSETSESQVKQTDSQKALQEATQLPDEAPQDFGNPPGADTAEPSPLHKRIPTPERRWSDEPICSVPGCKNPPAAIYKKTKEHHKTMCAKHRGEDNSKHWKDRLQTIQAPKLSKEAFVGAVPMQTEAVVTNNPGPEAVPPAVEPDQAVDTPEEASQALVTARRTVKEYVEAVEQAKRMCIIEGCTEDAAKPNKSTKPEHIQLCKAHRLLRQNKAKWEGTASYEQFLRASEELKNATVDNIVERYEAFQGAMETFLHETLERVTEVICGGKAA